MINSKNLTSEQYKQKLAKHIQEIENNTGAELVLAVATESGRYDRAESIWGVFIGLIMLSFQTPLEEWILKYFWTGLMVKLIAQSLLFVAGFIFGSLQSKNFLRIFSIFLIFFSISFSLNIVLVLSLPEGSPILVVPPPNNTIGLCPCF